MGITYRKNVIVVGAGASKEFGLPTGKELKKNIAGISDFQFDDRYGLRVGNDQIVDTLKLLVSTQDAQDRNINPYLHAARRIRDSMPIAPSIDNFLDTHSADTKLVEFGKLVITHAIISAEKESKLFVQQTGSLEGFDIEEVADTWLGQLFTILVAQRSVYEFIESLKSITFVSFNYDRCIYQFFAFASRNYLFLDDDGVGEVLGALNIIYPYGSVGKYDWGKGGRTNFGNVVFGQELIDKSRQLKTFTEGTDSNTPEQIFETMSSADVVMFMGFGFLGLNMDMLFHEQKFEIQKLLATGKGLSENSRQEVEIELRGIFKRVIKPPQISELAQTQFHLLDKTCGDLMFEFQRFLSV